MQAQRDDFESARQGQKQPHQFTMNTATMQRNEITRSGELHRKKQSSKSAATIAQGSRGQSKHDVR